MTSRENSVDKEGVLISERKKNGQREEPRTQVRDLRLYSGLIKTDEW